MRRSVRLGGGDGFSKRVLVGRVVVLAVGRVVVLAVGRVVSSSRRFPRGEAILSLDGGGERDVHRRVVRAKLG